MFHGRETIESPRLHCLLFLVVVDVLGPVLGMGEGDLDFERDS